MIRKQVNEMASQAGIDRLNESLWKLRFSDPLKVTSRSSELLKRSQRYFYEKGIACAGLNIAAACFYSSKNDKALKYLSGALAWFEKNRNEKGYPRALLLRGNISESFGDYEKTLNLWLEALKSAVAIKDPESESEACNQLGLINFRLNNYPKAIEYLNRGLEIREELEDENAVASSLNRIGMVLCKTKKFDESLGYYFRSLDIRTRNGQKSAIPWTLLGIASTYEDMMDYLHSIEYYEMAMNSSDTRCVLQCQLGSGRIYSILGNEEKAAERLDRSLQLARKIKSTALIAETYKALADHYERFKEPLKALRSFKQHLKAKESFQSSEVRSKLSNIEVSYAIERSEHEKEIYRLRHVELRQAYDLIEEKNRDITSSISYASRIQNAMLPRQDEVRGLSGKSFILYLPKDIVSGDFYWFASLNGKIVIAVGDCTGHGVPGALMSMLGISFLEEIVNSRKITEPGIILDELRAKIQKALHQKGKSEETKDGMDLSLCVIDKKTRIVFYSGAYNNLYLIHDNRLIEYRADRMPIGIHDSSDKNFSQHEIQLCRGDIIYMFTDGYADQFGGRDQKKFKYSAFRNLLTEIHAKPLILQKKSLESEFNKWKGNNPQTDDVTVVGIMI